MEESKQLVQVGPRTLSSMASGTADIAKQSALIQEVMINIMRDGTHYGIIPGCGSKKVLLQSGAQKLATAFSLRCECIERHQTDLPNDHREVRFRVVMKSVSTGHIFGEGVGCCTTMEKKYRYRSGSDIEVTDTVVPQAFWDIPKADWGKPEAARLLGGKNRTIKKVANKWYIAIRNEAAAIENPNPADCWNTIEKMAFKRAQVHAVINTTSCSDIFDQDLDELKQLMDEEDLIHVGDAPYVEQTEMPLSGKAGRMVDSTTTKQSDPKPVQSKATPVKTEKAPEAEKPVETVKGLIAKGPTNIPPGSAPVQYDDNGIATKQFAEFVLSCFKANIEQTITMEMLETSAGATVEEGWSKQVIRDLMAVYGDLTKSEEEPQIKLSKAFPKYY